jgi:hypothetical protein
MSDTDNTPETTDLDNDLDTSPEAELAALKTRAGQMGIAFSPRIGLEALRNKVNAEIASEGSSETPAPDEAAPVSESPMAKRARVRKEMRDKQLRLVRVRIANLDPSKKDLPGEIFTVSNKYLGAITKFIPFGEATDSGYHIPFILLNALKNRKFLQKRTKRGPKGEIILSTNWVSEFAIDELPALTKEELKQLANQQAAAVGLAQ